MAFLDTNGLSRLWAYIIEHLGKKVDKVDGRGLSTNDYTTAEKLKLDGIEVGATNTVVDSALSAESENPVQNKIIKAELDTLNNLIGDSSVEEQINTALAGISQPELDAIYDLAEAGYIEPITDTDNSVFVDETGNIYIY